MSYHNAWIESTQVHQAYLQVEAGALTGGAVARLSSLDNFTSTRLTSTRLRTTPRLVLPRESTQIRRAHLQVKSAALAGDAVARLSSLGEFKGVRLTREEQQASLVKDDTSLCRFTSNRLRIRPGQQMLRTALCNSSRCGIVRAHSQACNKTWAKIHMSLADYLDLEFDSGKFFLPRSSVVDSADVALRHPSRVIPEKQSELEEGHIRLVKIDFSSTPKVLIHCNTRIFRISDKPDYIALSYAWGSPHARHPIVLNGQQY